VLGAGERVEHWLPVAGKRDRPVVVTPRDTDRARETARKRRHRFRSPDPADEAVEGCALDSVVHEGEGSLRRDQVATLQRLAKREAPKARPADQIVEPERFAPAEQRSRAGQEPDHATQIAIAEPTTGG
jgi:hypothetical protein